ncbi:MAG TPA: quinolinate synthase NadA [Deltaproteobacteria bacterium]|jgi:quinolinate synthase|nr:quinolinate synthase NadA [Deltaproteobacteria bacterium]
MGIPRIQEEIRSLLKERNAVLLVHYYQRGEVQDIADILGDSLALSMEAAKTDARVIVFAGVRFMAESASILSPDKTVLLPRIEAGCPLADMITVEQLETVRKNHPDAAVVAYVNSSAAIKAHSDICCTSANAVRVVNSLTDAKKVLMVPDGNLARYTAKFTDKEIIPWTGYCPVHHFVTVEEVREVKKRYPDAPFAAHPECDPAVLEMADYVGSTGGIIRYAGEINARKIIVGTESGIIHQLKKNNPEKQFIPVSEKLICHDMKYTSLEDIRDSLVEMKHMITVPDGVRIGANRALSRMLAVS